jgi:tRNA(Ile)-lysidine synthase
VPGTDIPLLRPLLDWRKAELAALVAGAGLAAVDDPSNSDERFDRARLRKALGKAEWLDVPAIAASAAHLADADAALDWAARREWAECVTAEGLGLTYRPQAPRAIALRVLARIVIQLDGKEPRGGAVAGLFDALLEGRTSSIGDLVARPGRGGWTFSKAPVRRAPRRA